MYTTVLPAKSDSDCMNLLSSVDFLQNYLFFQKILPETQSECQTVWIQIRSDKMSVMIFVQTVCKGYQQMTKNLRCQGNS